MTSEQLQAMNKEQLIKWCVRLQDKLAQANGVIERTQQKNAELRAEVKRLTEVPY